MGTLGLKEQVYSELQAQMEQINLAMHQHEDMQQSNPDVEMEQPQLFGLRTTLVEEYQRDLSQLKRENEEKHLMILQLQSEAESLLKSQE
jgi:hypothetical protein